MTVGSAKWIRNIESRGQERRT